MKFTSLENLQYFLNKLSYISKESGLLNSIITSYLNDFKRDVIKIVSTLPLTGETGCLYLVPQGNNRFIEYYYNNDSNSYIQLGSSVFDVSVDSQLSNVSENTLQNKVILNALDSKLNASQLVNSLNNTSSETPQSQVIYDAFGDKIDSEDFLNISNNNIDMLFLAESEAYYDFEIKIPYDSKMTGNSIGSYADANTGDDTIYQHWQHSYNIMERFKFAGLTAKSFSNSTNSSVNIIFEDTNGNEYHALITVVNFGESSGGGNDIYYPVCAFDGYSNTWQGVHYWCYAVNHGNTNYAKDLIIKIHFTDAFKIDEKFNFSFYTSNYYDAPRQKAGSPRLEYVKVRGSTDLENYEDIVDLRNVWVSDYFKYNQHISEYLADRENSKWEFNLF